MEIRRDRYLHQLIDRQGNGQIKVITGIRRCGKSFLLKQLFKNHLLASGVAATDILTIELDENRFLKYRNPLELSNLVANWLENSSAMRYLFIDEIQMSDEVPIPTTPLEKRLLFMTR